MKKVKLNKNSGITLVALVVTIVVLLILAGIAISYVMGDNSVFKKASDAKVQTELGKIEERANLIYTDKLMQNIPDSLNNKPTMQAIVSQLETEGYKIEQVAVSGDAITGISLSRESMTLGFGGSNTIKVTLLGEDNNDGYTYYALVDGKYYQMHYNNGNITIDRTPSEIPDAGEKPTLTVSSSDETVATTTLEKSTNTITIVSKSKEGTTTVTVTYGSYIKTCIVKVSEESDWELIAKIAKEIAEGRCTNESNATVDRNSSQATVTVDGNEETIKVGQEFYLKHDRRLKKVRILGFNHDTLTNPIEAYGSDTNASTAGISFEFVESINHTNIADYGGSGGLPNTWLGAVYLRQTGLNQMSDSCRDNVKQVKKQYTIGSSNDYYSDEKLWLLSCSEVWQAGGVVSEAEYGYAKAKEGEQYVYYRDGGVRTKPNVEESYEWWLRSPAYAWSDRFCYVDESGKCNHAYLTGSMHVCPGFCL